MAHVANLYNIPITIFRFLRFISWGRPIWQFLSSPKPLDGDKTRL